MLRELGWVFSAGSPNQMHSARKGILTEEVAYVRLREKASEPVSAARWRAGG
jgi:thiamine biosynthesis protein ThiC